MLAALVAVVALRPLLSSGTVEPVAGPEAAAPLADASVTPADESPQPPPEPSGAPPSTAADVPTGTVTVHVTGAVAAPGVYELPAGSRVDDALQLAGGLTEDAQEDALNRAEQLADGTQIRVPAEGEEVPPPTASTAAGGGEPAGTGAPISLSTATAAELEELPGIGPALAAAIIEHREQHGPFGSVEQLDDVPGIGPSILSRVRDLVVP